MALAVSGGSDSTALMCLAQAWARAGHPGLKLTVLTVDHGLRPHSGPEARQVGEWAGGLGLPHHVLDWTGPKPSRGIQARAREARYGLLAAWCRGNGAGLLLTAHTMDDQAETVVMRLSRTASPDSLAGIPRHGAWQDVALYRPLLSLRRDALRAYLSARGQDWIEDPSNADRRFERIRVRQALSGLGRHGITPERLSTLAEASGRTALLLESMARRWLALWLREEDAGICHVAAEHFLGLPAPLQERILGRIVRHYGGGGFTPEPEELRRLSAWVARGTVRCTLGGALVGRRKRGFWVTREPGRITPAPLTIPESGTAVWDGRFQVTAAPGSTVTPAWDTPTGLGEEVPVFARRAYPLVKQPSGAESGVRIAFLRLAVP